MKFKIGYDMIGVRKSEGAKRMRKNLERYFAERREKKKTGNIRVTYEELLEHGSLTHHFYNFP